METYILREERDRRFALAAVQRAMLGKAVMIDYPKRSVEANRRLWSMLQAIANSDVTFDGQRWEAEDWKTILGSAWLRMNGREAGRLHRGTEGEPVMIGGFSSSRLNTKDFAEFCDSVLAFIDTNGVHWAEREQPPTEVYEGER